LCEAEAAAHHFVRAILVCGDTSGSVYLADVVGITMGPLVVTAVDLGHGPAVQCPVCFARHPLHEAWLGRQMDCPANGCHARLRVNTFVVRAVAVRADRRRPGSGNNDRSAGIPDADPWEAT
jgi:hypothetical protein